jgi:hypothetical protein
MVTVILEDSGDGMKIFGLIVYLIILGFLGVLCLFFPDKVQEFVIKQVNQGNRTCITFVESFMKSKEYLYVVRSVGVIAIIMFCFLAWAFFRNL